MSQMCNNVDILSTVPDKQHQQQQQQKGILKGTELNHGGSDCDNDNESHDVVDFVKPDVCLPCKQNNNNTLDIKANKNLTQAPKKPNAGTIYGDIEVRSRVKSSFSTLEKLPIFHFQRKKSDPTNCHTVTAKERPKFVKSASIARLLGNTYSTTKPDNTTGASNSPTSSYKNSQNSTKSSTYQIPERFQRCSENHIETVELKDFSDEKDISSRAFRSISKGLGKLLWRKSHSVDISTPDPEFKVSYLGNVLTGWAKGDSCIEKPLATLWRNYTQNNKPDVIMRVKVCPSGLKATTRQHGLTEYWSHRITHCSSPKNYPRVFCWIYRHEGRKLKHELRCHAVLCAKESTAEDICKTLRENLSTALREFKRDKINRQNARLSLVNSVYENPSMPRRKILLSVGGNNYRPPLERSKSAPRLMAIEEAIGEEDEEEEEEQVCSNQKPESRSCCTVDPLYPAMTLGRRRCKRGHSIRRTGNRILRKQISESLLSTVTNNTNTKRSVSFDDTNIVIEDPDISSNSSQRKSTSSMGSDDDLDKLLLGNDYDSKSPLAGELMSYFDMKFNKKASSLLDLQHEDGSFTLLSESTRNTLSLDDLDSFTDCDEEADEDDGEDVFFNQHNILDILANESRNLSMVRRRCESDNELLYEDNSLSCHDNFEHIGHTKNEDDENRSVVVDGLLTISQKLPQVLDSDEGSISSGCETASTVTTNLDEHPGCGGKSMSDKEHNSFESNAISEISIETKLTNIRLRNNHKNCPNQYSSNSVNLLKNDDSDSEFSDESGYVEYQDKLITGGCRSKSILI